MTTTYALQDFVGDMSELIDSQPDQEKLFDKGSSLPGKAYQQPGGHS